MSIDLNNENLMAALAELGIATEDGDSDSDELGVLPGYKINVDQLLKRSLVSLDNQIKDWAMNPTKPRKGWGKPVTIGFDTEYLTDEEAKEHRVLSYQFHLIGPHGVCQKIFYPESGERQHRLRLEDMLLETIQAAKKNGAVDDFPVQVDLCGFFLRLDLGTLADFDNFKRRLTNIGGKLGTNGDAVSFIPIPGQIENLPDAKSYITREGEDFPRIMSVGFMDVGSHAPEGSNLASIGEALGLPKLTIPPDYSIERMDELLAKNKSFFDAYALRDAEIAARFFIELTSLAKKISKVNDLPSTASNHGVALLRQTLKDHKIDFNQVFGLEDHIPVVFDEASGTLRKGKSEKVRINRRDMYEHFIAKCYHGGRNECFMAGPTEIGVFNDFDLAGAYTTGMVDFPVLDFEQPARISRNPMDYKGHVIGFAHVTFTYPEQILFPALPVHSEAHGLIFPLSGQSYCTAPEIEVALNQGCNVTILDGIIYEQVKDQPRVFAPFVMKIRELRAEYKQRFEESKKKSPDGKGDDGLLFWEKYIKLVGNGLYGKTAQGLKEKRAFNAADLKSVQLPPSPITYAACAAHVTGFVRAVMTEILHQIPEHRVVVSATTDGFLTNALDTELCLTGPLSARFNELHKKVAPFESKTLPSGEVVTTQKPMLELKHQGEQIIAVKTRGQLTASAFEDKPIILAKGSVSPPLKRTDSQSADEFKVLQNQYMVDLYLNRKHDTRTEIRPFVSLRDQMVHSKDVVRLTRSVRLNLEFDFKRKPIEPPIMRSVGDRQHIAFNTVPWNTASEVDEVRIIFDEVWRKKNCLKSLEDWHNWSDTYTSSLALSKLRKGKKTGINLTEKGAKGLVIRTFLRAYTRDTWGLKKSMMSYTKLADLLTGMLTDLNHRFPSGVVYVVTKNSISNEARDKRQPEEYCCPRTPETEALITCLKDQFPSLEDEKFIST